MSFLVIRAKGDSEPCSHCDSDVELFTKEAAEAKFLMIRLEESPTLGGGKCPACTCFICASCAVKTIYGQGIRRLHCPNCGEFLVGLRRSEASQEEFGAFLEPAPEFNGENGDAMIL